MTINSSSHDQPQVETFEKKPYVKPGFRYEQVFVTSAITCGKVIGGEGGCQHTTSSAS